MANTENIEAKLAAYVDGELDAAGRAEIEQYLTTNPQHRQLIDELRQAKNYLQELPRAAAPTEVAEMISQQLERASLLGDVDIGAGIGSTRFSLWPQMRAIAAIIILTLGLAGVLYYVLPSPKPSSHHVAIVTPEVPADDSTRLEKARPSGPVLADAEARERVAAGSAPSPNPDLRDQGGTAPGGPTASAAVAFGGGAGGAAPSGTLYLMVNTPDPASANTQVINYFASNQIGYEQIAEDDTVWVATKKEADQLTPDNRAQSPAQTRPDFDNVSPAPTNSPGAGNIASQSESAKDAGSATTNPTDKSDLAKDVAIDIAARKQQSAPSYFKAKMTREEATILCETLSQSKLGQIAQVVSPGSRQQLEQLQSRDVEDDLTRREKSAAEQLPGYLQMPTTNESSPPTDTAQQQNAVPPAYAAGTPLQGDVLAPGDSIRIRASEPLRSNVFASEQTQTIDEDGYVTLPNIGRVKAAGMTPNQLATSVIPQTQERNRELQAPSYNLTWSIEKVQPESAHADQKLPSTQNAGVIGRDTALAGAQPEPATGPTTNPTTSPSELGLAMTPVPGGEMEKVDVVVIVQNAERPTTVPTSVVPAPAPDLSLERRMTETVTPSTAPASASPTTHPTTFPAR